MMAQMTARAGTVRAMAPVVASPMRVAAPRRAMVAVAAVREVAPGQTKVYVGNISWETTKDDLFELFGKYGDVSDVFIPIDRESNRPRGFGFVTLEAAGAQAAVSEVNGMNYMGRELRVNEAQERDASAPREPREYGAERQSFNSDRPPREPRPPLDPSMKKLYLGNLSWEMNQEDITQLFEKFGKVHDVNLPMDRETGRPRGFAFVTLDASAAPAAISEYDGQDCQGRTMRVSEASEEGAERSAGGRGGGGFRGGRGGGGGGRGYGGGGGGSRY